MWRSVEPEPAGIDEAPQALEALVQAKAAGKHAVAEGHLGAVGGYHVGHGGQAHDALAPHVHVVAVVAGHDGLAGGAARGVQAHGVVYGDGKEAEGEGVAHDLLVGEGQAAHVVEGLDVLGLGAQGIELLAVPRDALVDVGDLVLEAIELQRADLIAGGALDLGHEDGHWGTFRD